MLSSSFYLSHVDILCIVYFAEAVEDWSAYGKLNVLVI